MPKIYQVDAFTQEKFKGNPAAVCLLDSPAEESWMQLVAAEMNLSETAFIHPAKDGFDLRWFTPTVEVDLCGHATLACAFVLYEEGLFAPDQKIRFHTKSGLLTATQNADLLEMDFPAEPGEEFMPPPILMRALGVTAVSAQQNRMDILIEASGEEAVRALEPDFQALTEIPSRGIIVTSPSDNPEYDFISRFFAPFYGINEDPVTGSAHCFLGPFWAHHLGKNKMCAFQASARGGVVYVKVDGDRVKLSGHAVMVLKGEIL